MVGIGVNTAIGCEDIASITGTGDRAANTCAVVLSIDKDLDKLFWSRIIALNLLGLAIFDRDLEADTLRAQ